MTGIGADVSERANRIPKSLGAATVERELMGQAVVVANCHYYGGGMWVAPQAIPNDGAFDVIIEGSIGKLEAMLKAHKLYSGTHFEDAGLRRKLEPIRGTKVEVSSPDRLLVQLDGKVVGQLPATLEIAPQLLRVIVPRNLTDKQSNSANW